MALVPSVTFTLSAGWEHKIMVGIRPEHLHAAITGKPEALDLRFDGVVEVVEPVGSHTMIQVRVGAAVLTAQIGSSERVKMGDSIVLTCQSSEVYQFDPKTELTLSSISGHAVNA